MDLKKLKLGFVPANRGFFSMALAAKMRGQAIATMESLGIEVVVPSPEQTKAGCIKDIPEAEIAGRLFRDAEVDGIVIGAVNFGDEQSAVWAVKKSGLDVPILIFGCQEEETLTMQTPRRDSFCGLLSIGDALRQIGRKYTVARTPICFPTDESFRDDIDWFSRICRVVNGVRNARYGQVGTRPNDFWTCRFDEKQLQRLGPTTVVMDLSEAIAGAAAIKDEDPDLGPLIGDIHNYADVSAIRAESVARSAKLELFLKRWGEANMIDAFAIQCWTSIQANYGVCSCTTMSRLGDVGKPSACEADILGALSMHTLMLAAGSPAGLADWNNLHNEDDEVANIWHCGVFPATFAKTKPKLGVQEIIASSGAATYEDSQGTVEFVSKPGPITLARVTQDADGNWRSVLAEGAFEDNPAVTFGGYGWCRIPGLQKLYREVLLQHFPHHVGLVQGHVANVLYEAYGNYLGLKVHFAGQPVPGLYTPALPF